MTSRWRWTLAAVGVALVVVAGAWAGQTGSLAHSGDLRIAAGAAGPLTKHTVPFGGEQRVYWVYRPASAPAGKPAPMVVVLYARGFPAPDLGDYEAAADRGGFLLVYPVAKDGWQSPSELDFIRTAIDAAKRSEGADAARVYVTGGSWSGFIAYRLACGPQGIGIAGIGGLFGGIQTKSLDAGAIPAVCKPQRPLTIVEVHGQRDRAVPYDGFPCHVSKDSGSYVCLPSQQQLMSFWARTDGCPDTSTSTQRSGYRLDVWAPCKAGTAVELVTVPGGGHTPQSLVTDGLTPIARMWEFFQQHPGSTAVATAVPFSATVASVRALRTGSRRTVIVRISLTAPATARLTLKRSGKFVAVSTVPAQAGASALRLGVPRKAARGEYVLLVSLTGPGGAKKTFTRSVAVPR